MGQRRRSKTLSRIQVKNRSMKSSSMTKVVTDPRSLDAARSRFGRYPNEWVGCRALPAFELNRSDARRKSWSGALETHFQQRLHGLTILQYTSASERGNYELQSQLSNTLVQPHRGLGGRVPSLPQKR